jgi:tetratricopeptide (TPR) repeat protein
MWSVARAAQMSVVSLFFSGDHRAVAERTIDSPQPSYSISDFPYVVGALVMLGRIDEAETTYLLRKGQLTPEQKTACRFFLGMGFCRHSFYDKSRRYFTENAALRREASDAVSRFYRYQGLGFYAFFAGRMRKALSAAEKSFDAALEAGFLYGRAFAADLKGHALVQTGQVGHGLRTLELAEHLASQLGAEWLKETIQSSLLIYRTRFGIEGGVAKIIEKLGRLSKQDVYTQSGLLLELSQEYLKLGRLTEAKEKLNESCRIIYGVQNRRHAALLNLRYAHVHFLEGEPHLALNLVRNSITQIVPEVDIHLELRLRGFERKLVRHLKLEVCEKALEEIVTKLTLKVGEAIGLRMLAREKGTAPTRFGEDPIGDLWDLIHRDPSAGTEAILKSGQIGLLAEVLPIARGERTLYLELEPGSLTVFDKGNVEHYPETLSRSLRVILTEIAKGPRTKEELVENIWKYEYHPLRHDPLIYSAIAKLRKVLGKRSHWIEATDAGYQLRSEVKLVVPAAVPEPERTGVVEAGPELNHRQRQILKLLAQNEFIDTATCRTLFDTSEITASRDLSEMAKLLLIDRVGRGRATKYRRKLKEAQI